MKRSKLILISILGLLAIIVIWRIALYIPQAQTPETPKESKQVADPNKPTETKLPDVNEPNEPGDINEPNEPAEPNEPTDPMEALNLKDVQMKDIVQKLADWTDKVIISSDEAMKQKITIYSSKKLPRSQALELIYSALRAKGFIAEHTENAIFLKPIKEASFGSVPMVPPDVPLASIQNKQQIVQKFWKLKNYSPSQMSNILLPLIGEYGYVGADENTNSLLIIDTVENLIKFERIITQFDVPEAEKTVKEIFTIKHGDCREIVQLLDMLLTDSRSRGRNRRPQPAPKSKGGKSKGSGEAKSVVIESVQTPINLIPMPKYNWIIVKASAEDMKEVADWIERLDKPEMMESESETVQITYADVREVANSINQALQQMPGEALKTSVVVKPLTQARQIMIFGRKEVRNMVKKLIEEVDIPTGKYETEVFDINHADPEQIKKNIDELYGEDTSQRGYYYRRRGGTSPTDKVKAIAWPSLKQVTVIASPENLKKIKGQIKDWDVPIDVDSVKPRIIELKNSDPVRMTELLSTLFTETEERLSFWDRYFGTDQAKEKIVGPLYGQLTFEAVPDTKKIIVISNIPEAYVVIEKLIEELDRMEVAELPMIITLKYADAEDLCEQLNAILNEPGTTSTIRRSRRGLSEYTIDDAGRTKSEAAADDSDRNEQANIITPWWNRGYYSRSRVGEEMPTSNLIGRIRFIPVYRSKALLVLSPKEYQQSVREMIAELDRPAKQVIIKAIIMQVDHKSMTSLGVKFSSNPSAFGTLGDNVVSVLSEMAFAETAGSFAIESGADITALIDFLVEHAQAKVLNQPTLFTKDNEEADFFKGRLLPFIVSEQTSTEGTATRDSVTYRPVGVTLRVRPNITPEKAVDMTINLSISKAETELVDGKIATSLLDTTTHMIVDDGQTIMLGGILFQADTETKQKIPLFGDLPLVGGLFRHTSTTKANNELIAFITPHVIDADSSPEALEALDTARRKLENTKQHLNTIIIEEQ